MPRSGGVGAVILSLGVALLLFEASSMAMGRPATTSGESTGPRVDLASWGACATHNATCTFHPAVHDPAGLTYFIVAFVHGPGAAPGAVVDSLGDTFHNLSYCWLHNGVFGHTVIYVGNATLRHPANYAFTLQVATPLVGGVGRIGSGEYVEMAMAFSGAITTRTDAWANSCENHWTNATQTTLPVRTPGSRAGDLAIYYYALGEANRTTGPISCAPDVSTVASCGVWLSGSAYGNGLSWPSLAYAYFDYTNGGNGSIEASGGGYGVSPCPWDASYVELTSG
jgi:hypothetical protein